MRANSSGVISFGLVTIPVKVYTATSSNTVSFRMITPKGNLVKQTLVDEITNEPVERSSCLKGYEWKKGSFVTFKPEEIKALESTDASKSMAIREFVPAESVDSLYVEKTHFLGPDKGGDRGYQLLAATMQKTGKVAVAQWTSHGKEHLVLIRPYRGHLILQEVFYAEEVRDVNEIDVATQEVSALEEAMASKLIEALSNEAFDPTKYKDSHAKRVRAAVDAKIAGQEVPAQVVVKDPTVIDLFEALKASLQAQS